MRIRIFEMVVAATALTAMLGCATSPRAKASNLLAWGSASDAGDPSSASPLAPPPDSPAPTPPAPTAPASAVSAPPPHVSSPCAPPPCAPPPCYEVPCGRSQWHLRGLVGFSTWLGDDAGEECGYVGADIGRALCGSCWSLDAFWRGHTAHFSRDPDGEDGGWWHHVGLKASHERSLGGRWFGYVGAGPQYFWTDGYLNDDSGFGVFGEAGIGYSLSRNWRVRAGVDVHGMYTDVGRQSPADDNDERWLWKVAPYVGLEFSF
jgi:hypothetical protein